MGSDRPEKVGTVKQLSMSYIRGTKLKHVEEICVTPWDVKHNKRFALYPIDLSTARISSTSQAGAIETMNVTCSMSDHVLTASYPSLPDLVIDIQELESRQAVRVTGVPTKNGLDGRAYVRVSEVADAWFTKIMGKPVTLLYTPETTLQGDVNLPVYICTDRSAGPVLPVHIVCQSTVDKLNTSTAPVLVGAERFRPNILVEGSVACDEVEWQVVRVGDQVELEMAFVNPRCGTINALDGRYEPEFLNALQKYGEHRDKNNKICMGIYYRVLRPGVVRVGDEVVVLKRVREFTSGPDRFRYNFLQ
eukprot:sb/3467235/